MRTSITLSLVVMLISVPLVSAKCWYFGTQRYCHGQISVSPSINIQFSSKIRILRMKILENNTNSNVWEGLKITTFVNLEP